MKIAILGCGYYGLPMAKALINLGHEILGSTTTEAKLAELSSEQIKPFLFRSPEPLPSEIHSCDLLILNIPPRPEQLDWFKSWKLSPRLPIIFISSTSVYAETGKASETSPLSPVTNSGEILKQEEAWIQNHFESFTVMRCGGLIGGTRHPGKSLSGKKNIKGPNQPVNLIHLDDVIGFTLKISEKDLGQEIYNLVSDEHHSKKEFYGEFCKRQNLPLPEFDSEDLSLGKIVDNKKLKAIYSLKYPTMLGTSL